MAFIRILCFCVFALFFNLAQAETAGVPIASGPSDTQAQVSPVLPLSQAKTVDIDKDGDPDITYYKDGEYVGKVEADTNNDGKADITINIKDGKFQNAFVDTDYDGTADKEFKDDEQFLKWANENKPDYADKLNQANWKYDMLDF
ncbi:MAG: hypothetical protein WCY12_01325 [Candidatus Omnitrophota bacterium]